MMEKRSVLSKGPPSSRLPLAPDHGVHGGVAARGPAVPDEVPLFAQAPLRPVDTNPACVVIAHHDNEGLSLAGLTLVQPVMHDLNGFVEGEHLGHLVVEGFAVAGPVDPGFLP